jgi:hypothetical protein
MSDLFKLVEEWHKKMIKDCENDESKAGGIILTNRYALRKLCEATIKEVIKKHRDKVVITCEEDCWCWDLEQELLGEKK